MALRDYVQARPRSTGEILDDAWRLYLGDLALLLALTGLFLLPAAGVAIWLAAGPYPESGWGRAVLPALAALLFPLTGLASGACQEAFHLRAEGHAPRLRECLTAALRRGLNHVTSQALALILPALALLWFVIPDLHPFIRWSLAVSCLALAFPLWLGALGRHAALAAGQKNLWRSWRNALRGSGRHPARALVVVLTRLAFFLFALLNLHLLLRFFLWAAEDLGGFNVALLRVFCVPGNPVYLLALLGLAWWLLAPYAEAVNYLFFVDDRTRYEGLDLWFRVEEQFPAAEPTPPQALPVEPIPEVLPANRPPSVLAPGLALLALLLAPAAAPADALSAVRQARKEVTAIRAEVQSANPYPGGQRWAGRLDRVGKRLEDEAGGKGGFTWYRRETEGFAGLPQGKALKSLDRVEGRLGLLEDSLSPPPGAQGLTPEEIKALVSPETRRTRPKVRRPVEDDPEPKKPPPKREPREGGDGPPPRIGGGGPGMIGGAALGGLANVLLVLLIGLVAAVVVVGVVLLVLQWQKGKKAPPPKRQQGATGPEPEGPPEDLAERDPVALWAEADELARRGDFLAAVRVLYLSVLALLNQQGLIRYERTRTNGEYADQLRRRRELHGPFCRLTGLFELKWYGERACRESDYQSCRGFAEELRQGVERPEPVGAPV
jgi:hypothetical protein